MFFSYEGCYKQQPNATLLNLVLRENHVLEKLISVSPIKDLLSPMNLFICSNKGAQLSFF